MTKDISRIPAGSDSDLLRRSDYFPTMVYSCLLHDAEDMNREILAAIYNERSRDGEGIERSNFKSLGGWHSQNNLHKDKAFKRLTDRVNRLANGIGRDLGYSESHHLRITTMWSISNPPGSSNRAHVHPGALWSGVYYVQAPEGAGKIEFIEPRTMHLMNQPVYKPKTRRRRECWTKVKVTPVAGKALFFPSWLYHSVEPNLAEGEGSEAERIIISFNINQVRKKS